MSSPSIVPPHASQLAQSAVVLSFGIYVGTFACAGILYTFLRPRLLSLYQPRVCIRELNCALSSRVYRSFGWIVGAMRITDDELLENAGLDAAALIRLLRLGTKIALVGAFNAVYLVPIYKYKGIDHGPADELSRWTLSHLPAGSTAMLATVIAAYVIFGFALFSLYREFAWYTPKRHAWMSRNNLASYTVFVRQIPPSIRSNRRLRDFFDAFITDGVVDVSVALDVSQLEGMVKRREALVLELEHAYNVFKVKGRRLKKRTAMCSKEKVDTITSLTSELATLNQLIGSAIDEAEAFQEASEEDAGQRKMVGVAEVTKMIPLTPLQKIVPSKRFRAMPAGFVTFRTLQATMIALQIQLYRSPFALCIEPAPLPEKVYWTNVGIPHAVQQLGFLVSLASTITLCIFWTIPVTFVVSISKVSFLKEQISFLKRASDSWPPLDILLQLVSPTALAILNELLPVILRFFSKLEGHVSLSTLETSVFTKLAIFYIVQTFCVSAIAGSLLSGLKDIMDRPLDTLQKALAINLPRQSNYFITFVFAQIGISLTLEFTRFVPALLAVLRKCVGPHLSKKECSRPFLFLKPLSIPAQLEADWIHSIQMLFFMILLVYSVMSPIVCVVMAFAFSCYTVVYKIEFASVYDPSSDTGGRLWPRAIRIILFCMILAQFTLIGVLATKRAIVASPLMIPLFVATVLFWCYLEQRHFVHSEFIPADIFVATDIERSNNNQRRGCYNPKAMCERRLDPEIPPGLDDFCTSPAGTENGDENASSNCL